MPQGQITHYPGGVTKCFQVSSAKLGQDGYKTRATQRHRFALPSSTDQPFGLTTSRAHYLEAEHTQEGQMLLTKLFLLKAAGERESSGIPLEPRVKQPPQTDSVSLCGFGPVPAHCEKP